MVKWWEPNPNYQESEPQSFDNRPYKRLYENLTQSELLELIQDAKRQHWEVLDLSMCGLHSLPDELWGLSDLRFLDLGNVGWKNTPSGGDNTFESLPASIGNLTNLQRLLLDNSLIQDLPDSIGKLTNLQ